MDMKQLKRRMAVSRAHASNFSRVVSSAQFGLYHPSFVANQIVGDLNSCEPLDFAEAI